MKTSQRALSLRVLRSVFALAFGAALSTPFSPSARAEGTLIPAPDRFDFVHDAKRGLVLISSGAQILRYRLADGVFLSPIQVGGRAQGLDIAPDGDTLAVADGAVFSGDASVNQANGRIVLVNLDTLAQSSKTFALGYGESGAYSLAFDYTGNALISPNITINDPGFRRPLRRFYAASNYVGTIGESGTSSPPQTVEARTIVTRDTQSTLLGFAENGGSSALWGTLSAFAGSPTRFVAPPPANFGARPFLDLATDGTNWFLSGASPNPLQVRDRTNNLLATMGSTSASYDSSPAFVAADSTRQLLYLARKGGASVEVLDSKNRALKATLDGEENIGFPTTPYSRGRLRLASDGSLLMESQTGGVRIFKLQNGLPTAGNGLTTPEDTPLRLALPNPFPSGAPPYFALTQAPRYGYISGYLPNATYIPYRDFNGADSFSYSVSDGTTTKLVTVPISVTPVDDPFVGSNPTKKTRIGWPVAVYLDARDADDITPWVNGNDSYPRYPMEIVRAPGHGTLVAIANSAGYFTYTPEAGFEGTDTFSFRGTKPSGEQSSPGTATITVTGALPIARDDRFVLRSDGTASVLTVPAPGIVANDYSAEGYFSMDATSNLSDGGRISQGNPGAISYYPAAGEKMPTDKIVTFQYAFNDGVTFSNRATVTLDIKPFLAANALSFNGDEDSTFPVTLAGRGIAPLSFRVVTPPTNGTLSGTAPDLFYTPAKDFNGGDSFTFQTVEGDGSASNTATVNIQVQPVNDAPVASDAALLVTEDVPAVWIPSGSDAENTPLSFRVLTAPTHGVVTFDGANGFLYTPAKDFNGNDSFTFVASDGTAAQNGKESAPATVSVSVAPVNDAPVPTVRALFTDEDTPLNFALSASDVDGDVLIYSIVTPPANGVLSGETPDLTFTPNANWSGETSFRFSVSDGQLSVEKSGVITVNPVNDAPVAASQSVSLDEDTSQNITLSASDAESAPLTFSVETSPKNGVLSGTAPNLVYTPNANFNGADSFTFKANDGALDSAVATVSLLVRAVNDAPKLLAQNVYLNEDEAKTFALRASDVEGAALAATVVTSPTNGALVADGLNFSYTPNLNFNGTDSFSVKVSDGALDSDTVTVTLYVKDVDDNPLAVADLFTGAVQNSRFTMSLYGPNSVTSNDTNFDGPQTMLYPEIVTQPRGGTVAKTSAGFVYTPNSGWSGTDSFTYRVTTYTGAASAPATISIVVASLNRAPIAQNGSLALDEDTPKTLVLAASDPDGDALTYSVVTPPKNGALSGTAPNLVYTPAANWSGSDSFTFKTSDGKADSNSATVSISVRPVNDAPVALPASIDFAYGTSKSFVLTGSDIEGQTLSFSVLAGPTNGTLTGSNINRNYTPRAGFIGTDSFTFRTFDGALYSAPGTITLVVAPPAPTATARSISLLENTSITIPLSGTAGGGASVQAWEVVANPSNGTLSGAGDARLYTPNRFFSGADSFTFRVRDSRGIWSAPALVSIAVILVNQAPSFAVPTPTLTLAKNSPAQSRAAFITQISSGPPNESGQTLAFSCTNSNPGLFSGQPTIAANGTLSFTPKNGATGTATVQTQLRDNGGTANGGQDSSQPKTFTIRLG